MARTQTAAAKKAPVIVSDESAVAQFSSETLKQHVNALKAALERKDQANADVKSTYAAAAKAGVPKGELKFIVEARDYSDDFKANVNIMREMLGQKSLFDLPTHH